VEECGGEEIEGRMTEEEHSAGVWRGRKEEEKGE
jgi:hypothetical protein